MDIFHLLKHPLGNHGLHVTTVDSHTAGEATRLIVDGLGSRPGKDILEKRLWLMNRMDHIRLLLTREPRGHRELLAAALIEPVTPEASFGLIYMDARRYPYLCGHATIGAVTTLLEMGALPMTEPETVVIVDTPSGPMKATAVCEKGWVESVAFVSVPAFVFQERTPLDVPGFGSLTIDLVYAGGFFAMIAEEDLGMELSLENRERILDLGRAVIQAANKQCHARHPERPEVCTVDVAEFYAAHKSGEPGRSMVVYGERHLDRSPCGTGTTAKAALFHRRGLLALNEAYANRSPLNTEFQARVVEETTVGEFPAVRVEIQGSAQITGKHTFVLDTRDPFPEGFLL